MENIRATTPSDRAASAGLDERGLTRGAKTTLAAALLVGLGLFALTVPRLLGAVTALPAGSILREIRNDQTVSEERLELAARALEESRQWSGTPAYTLSDLALLDLLLLQSVETSGIQTHPLLEDALEAQETGIAKAPVGASSWARLADARYLREGLTPATRDALELSLLSREIDLPLLRFRLHLLLFDWPAPEPAFAEAVREQIHALTRYGKRGYEILVDLSLIAPRGDVIQGVLADTPRKQAVFAYRLARRLGTR